MSCVRAGASLVGALGGHGLVRVAAPLLLLVVTANAPADIFHLTSGGTIEGQKLEAEGDQYKIRTVVGVVSVPVSAVERIEEAVTPFDEYDRRAAQAVDTPEDQTALAAWCEEQGLRAERRQHLLRAVELDSDYAPARRALGYVRVGEMWVDGRRVIERAQMPEAAEGAELAERQQLARAIQGQWYRRIRAIKDALLDHRDERLVQEGRAKIMEIKDPLAILPLSQVLSAGSVLCRALLVSVLSGFLEDEATMNLGVIALVDPDAEIRRLALVELARRNDPRVVAQYREALRNGNEAILARAAAGLGCLGAAEAIPDLVEALTVRRNKWVEVSVRRYFYRWPQIFCGVTMVYMGTGSRAVHMPQIGVPCDRISFRSGYESESEWQFRRVTVFRTEALEALKRITGQNFGFDRDQWRRWYEESKQ